MNILKTIYYNKYFPRILYVKPDGGKDSGVTGYFLIEWKTVFSIGLLRFRKGSREAFHSHAFNAVTFWLKGSVTEECLEGDSKPFKASFRPKITKRSKFHKVIAHKDTWALTFRGPWVDYWMEFKGGKLLVLTHGRKLVDAVTSEGGK